ncbi:ABC transporter ATP-binding protein [Candidatus Woesearchaeota archaeon CG10_big_fil_rev_8_21_14_0_10_34_12]|nr:MAG: ABC transporter ATP-binding protein [Candidatus Woesearchaeota archaeon CG10_big_fil_rev_8_21_14_0_10_34_12]
MSSVIKLDNLTKKFGEFTAVDNISFEIKEGEIFGFLGPNGAGKTTTLSMLSTLLEPTSGKASVNNFDIKTQKDNVRKSIGIVFQDPTLDDELTAYENMDFHGRFYSVPKEIRKKKIIELLRLVQLEDRRDSLVKTFSGGMKRRLEITRGLLHEPKVLFLDEPTIGLDPQTRNSLWEYIKNLNKNSNLTIIITTHYMDEADKLCNRIAIIDHGKIEVMGTPKNLKSKIGGDIISIESFQTEEIKEIFAKCSWCKSSKIHNHTITANVKNAETHVAEIVGLLEAKKIKISSLNISPPTLEDVFLHYTGKTIREQEANPVDVFRLRKRAMRRR